MSVYLHVKARPGGLNNFTKGKGPILTPNTVKNSLIPPLVEVAAATLSSGSVSCRCDVRSSGIRGIF